MIIIIFLAIFSVMLTFVFHFKVLQWLSVHTPSLAVSDQSRVLIIILALFLSHIIEIGLYAITFACSIEFFDLGTLEGNEINDPMEYFYFSSVIFTSLGIGDVFPMGHIRFLTGIEALNGLLLIAWSASFTFHIMGTLWPQVKCCNSVEKSAEDS